MMDQDNRKLLTDNNVEKIQIVNGDNYIPE